MATPVLRLFDERLTKGEIEPDPAQREVAIALDALAEALRPWRPSRARVLSLFTRPQTAAPRGLYIHGGVGRGKTMLMDLFYEAVEFTPKNRCHFCEFMAGVHDKIARARHAVDGDPIPYVAAAIAADAGLLCFDEFQVTDIADAMILGRLFKVLFERGVVVVATSNAEPADLYKNGLNRQLFLPFIAELERRLECRELRAAKDFRLDKLSGRPLYFCPANAAARAALDTHWERLTGHHSPASAMLEVKGRKVIVPLASMGVARFRFSDLCEVPLGAIDYLSIAHAFHTLLIEDIPT